MAKYRKRPVIIEAEQLQSHNIREIRDWVGEQARIVLSSENGGPTLAIDTLEGTMTAKPGDWVIRGVMNEHYPCADDIFQQTYEPVE